MAYFFNQALLKLKKKLQISEGSEKLANFLPTLKKSPVYKKANTLSQVINLDLYQKFARI